MDARTASKKYHYSLENSISAAVAYMFIASSARTRLRLLFLGNITRFESMSFVVNILACKLKIVNNRN